MRSAGASALLGPPRCVACGVRARILCTRCRGTIVPGGTRPPSHVDRAVVACSYEGVARSLVLALKLGARRAAAEEMADLLHQAVLRSGTAAGCVCWVPGRRSDARRRGFDHAQVLAEALARPLGLPVVALLARTDESTADQTELGAAARRANADRVFTARGCTGTVALVDDVVTTGATAAGCAGALRAAGASGVDLLCFSSTPLG